MLAGLVTTVILHGCDQRDGVTRSVAPKRAVETPESERARFEVEINARGVISTPNGASSLGAVRSEFRQFTANHPDACAFIAVELPGGHERMKTVLAALEREGVTSRHCLIVGSLHDRVMTDRAESTPQ